MVTTVENALGDLLAGYKIILSDDPNELATAVEESIRHGWEPFGGIAIAFSPTDPAMVGKIACAQAMVRYSPPAAPSEG